MDARRIETQFQTITGGKWIHPARIQAQISQSGPAENIYMEIQNFLSGFRLHGQKFSEFHVQYLQVNSINALYNNVFHINLLINGRIPHVPPGTTCRHLSL